MGAIVMGLYSYPKNIRVGYPYLTGYPVLSADPGMQLRMHSIACVNGSATATDIGIGYYLGSGASGVFTANGGAATAFSSGSYLASIGNQLYFQSDSQEILDFIVFHNSVASSGGAPAFTYEYWNGAWTAITPQVVPNFAVLNSALILGAPLDWIVGTGGVSGLDASRYSFRINATGAPASPATAANIYTSKLLLYRESVDSKQALEVNFENFGQQFLMNVGQNIIPYFSQASNNNSVELGYRQNP